MNKIFKLKFPTLFLLVSALMVIGCDIGPSNESSVNTSGNAADLTTYGVPESEGSYVVFNQRLIEGLSLIHISEPTRPY